MKELGLASALTDGEIVVEGSDGLPSFTLLQADLKSDRSDRFCYVLFDLLYCEGFDLTQATLRDRKSLLQQIVAGLPASRIRFSEHLEEDGPTMFEHACRLGLEGIVSKRIDLPYRGGRGEHWLKTKSVLRQEFIILGYVPSTAATGTLGALRQEDAAESIEPFLGLQRVAIAAFACVTIRRHGNLLINLFVGRRGHFLFYG